MKVIALNGSPRKNWNTATMLQKALDGAAAQGAETELIHLYDLNFKGCRSCFACKTKNGPSYGRCASKDDLTPVLQKIADADALILGSPMYFGSVSAEMRAVFERLLFPYLVYARPPRSLCPKKMRAALIYTMNCPEEFAAQVGYDKYFAQNEGLLSRILGSCTSLQAYDTCQFEDYSKVVSEMMDPAKKAARRTDAFPQDCQKAFELGAKLARAD